MDFIWNVQTPDHICDLYTQCLLKSSDRMIAWEHWRGKTEGSTYYDWHPGMNVDEQDCNLYETYFPTIVNKANDCRKVLTYRVDKTLQPHQMWLNLPRLDFLPSHVNDVIAGAGGLLCVNGGEQSLIGYQSSMYESSKHEQRYRKGTLKNLCEQSILLICNPLTKEIKYLPIQTSHCINNGLVAQMVFCYPCTQTPPPHDHITKRQRSEYKLIVLGNHERIDRQKHHVSHEVILLTYDSKIDEWISGTSINNARVLLHIKTDIAVVGDCLFMGGQTFVGYQRLCVDEPKSEIWENKLFRVSISQGKWNKIDFCIEDHERKVVGMQAPIIVQCKPGGEVYAVTRKTLKPNTIHIYQVMLANDNPTGVMRILTCMPEDIFLALFEEIISLKAYECTAGLHYIAFLASFSSQSVVAVYDLYTSVWSLSKRPIDRGCLARFSLVRCEWAPNFQSKP